MVRRSLFQALRRRGAALGAVLTLALLLNVVLAGVLSLQAVAAALDPLAAAVNCDPVGSGADSNPVGHKSQHEPDCALCGPACPMAGAALALGGAVALVASPPAAFDLHIRAQRHASINPPSLYRSDADAQAPPARG